MIQNILTRMKKKLIFICCEMGKGGVSKSLASLLNTIKNHFDLILKSMIVQYRIMME